VLRLAPARDLTPLAKVVAGLQLLAEAMCRRMSPRPDGRRLLAGRPAPDLIIANDIEMLPLAFHVAADVPVIFDCP